MRIRAKARFVWLVTLVGGLTAAGLMGPAFSFTPRQEPAQFDNLILRAPGSVIGLAPVEASALPAEDVLRQGWDQFSVKQGGWRAWIDERSGLPSLAMGRGIAWVPGRGNSLPGGSPTTVEQLETLARNFLAQHVFLLGEWKGQLVLDPAASVFLDHDAWQITFRQVVNGVPVRDSRYDFHVSQGNLVAFGAFRWSAVNVSTAPSVTREAARAALDAYLGLSLATGIVERVPGVLNIIPLDAARQQAGRWSGSRGAGYTHSLVWHFEFEVPGQPALWAVDIDAQNGNVVSFTDETKYERIKGSVYPLSDDGLCPSGCAQPDFPMPFVDYSTDGGPAEYTGDHGLYECSSIGSEIKTTLIGPYIRVHDNCGAISQTTLCDDPLDLGISSGTDCTVPEGASPGDTHSSRSSFYHLNRSMEKGRAWLPSNTWLASQLTDNVNINATCNAYWSGSVNFYKSGGGCRNTGEIAAVFVHEWGHGIDQNDGGGYDNPSEAYADVVAELMGRQSCIGRGFYMSHSCDGYGNACLDCTGIRDQNWDMRANHTPSTPAGFISTCSGGGGPCGKEEHCEGYLAGEVVYDLATRDLPASGVDQDSAWQMVDKWFFKSRGGSGGDAYNCTGSSGDSCGTNSWYHKFRLIDDDDGNLANGTPHAAAIFAAFNRHQIACGTASDATNQNSSSCPSLAKPAVTFKALSNAIELTWPTVPNAATYRILRGDLGCDYDQIPVGQVSATTFLDDGLSNEFTVYYRVQAVGSNGACESPVSNCIAAAPQPLAGTVKFLQATYGCNNDMTIKVTDANVGASFVNVQVWSTSEPAPETLTLNETSPGSGKFMGSIHSAAVPPVTGDNLLSTAHGDALNVQYIDADDGNGGFNIPRTNAATSDCIFPVVYDVNSTNVTNVRATVNWSTDELSDTVLLWGPVKPPSETATGSTRTTAHSVTLTGLSECTVYWYEVHSTDPAGNLASSNNGGQYYHFETLGNFGDGLQPCHAGRVTIDKTIYSCTDTATFRVVDQDLNIDPLVAETTVLLVTSSTEIAGEEVIVTETGPNTSKFTGSIPTARGTPAADGVLQTSHQDALTVTYRDTDDGTGAPSMSFSTATLDCSGPTIQDLTVDTITSSRATIRFTTSEPGDTVVEWGPTPALGQTKTVSGLVSSHSVTLNQFDVCQAGYFRVKSTDSYGNQAVAEMNGAPFNFYTYNIPGLYYRETFENNPTGWTLEGEWEIAAPQGLGGSAGQPDPQEAYNNTKVLGDDLTGKGAFPGDFEPSVTTSAKMPTQNATTWTHTKILFHRLLHCGVADGASIWLWSGGSAVPIYREENVSDGTWVLMTQDASGRVDGKTNVFLEFKQKSNAGGNYSGMNIDDIIFKDGTLPDYAACANCGSAPAFGGAVSAIDNNACGATGVTVSWKKASAWGSGTSGTYAVYRGTTSGFPADTAHLIASGVATLSYNDATAPAGNLYYLVRAENDETCSTGPKNHGKMDANIVYQAVRETTSRPTPAAVTNLDVNIFGGAHLRLTWTAAAEATLYRVYRGINPQPGQFGVLAETEALKYDDLNSGATQETYFYLVRGVNPCSVEGP